MMPTPHVTVLTAVHNGANFISETISSIHGQTFSDWEYIIVDDASNDGTPDLVEQIQKQDSRIHLLRRFTVGGPYVSANEGLKSARGEYIVRIDADDLAAPFRIDLQLKFLRENPQYRACISPWQEFFDKVVPSGKIHLIPLLPRVLCWYIFFRPFASHSSLCIERTALEELGGYRELSVSQDFHLITQLSRNNWLGVVPEIVSFVRKHPMSLSRTMGTKQVELSIPVMNEQLYFLTGQTWKEEDLRNLFSVSQATSINLKHGINLLARWKSLWKDSLDLNHAEKLELEKLYSSHLCKLLLANAKLHPVGCLGALMKLLQNDPQQVPLALTYFWRVIQSKISVSKKHPAPPFSF